MNQILLKINILIFFLLFVLSCQDSNSSRVPRNLIDEGAHLIIHDPQVHIHQIESDIGMPPFQNENQSLNETNNNEEGKWESKKNLDEVFINSDAVLIITEWEQYSNIDWPKISQQMRSPAWVFDARSMVDPEKVINSGLNLWRIGDGS